MAKQQVSAAAAAVAGALAHAAGGRQLLQQQEQELPHAPRVLGVGVGVFLLAFFLVVCVLLGLLGSRTTKPGLCYAASAGLYSILLLLLVASPKGAPPPPSPVGYDATIVPLLVTLVAVSLAAVGSVGGLLVFHVKADVYARPLSYHADVLHQQ